MNTKGQIRLKIITFANQTYLIPSRREQWRALLYWDIFILFGFFFPSLFLVVEGIVLCEGAHDPWMPFVPLVLIVISLFVARGLAKSAFAEYTKAIIAGEADKLYLPGLVALTLLPRYREQWLVAREALARRKLEKEYAKRIAPVRSMLATGEVSNEEDLLAFRAFMATFADFQAFRTFMTEAEWLLRIVPRHANLAQTLYNTTKDVHGLDNDARAFLRTAFTTPDPKQAVYLMAQMPLPTFPASK